VGQEAEHFLEFDDTVTVTVEFFQKSLNVGRRHANLNATEHGVELNSGQDAVLVGVEFAEDLSEDVLVGAVTDAQVEELVSDGLDHVLHLNLGDSGGSVLNNTPDGLEHANEVVVLNHGHAQVGVVVEPVLFADRFDTVAHKVEAQKELTNDFFFGSFLVNEVLVAAHIVGFANLFSRYASGLGFIDLAPGGTDDGLAALGERIAHAFNKLFVTDHTCSFI